MEMSLAKLSLLLLFCGVLLASCYATPIGNNWHVSDPRCFGRAASSYRLRRYVTTNNNSSAGGGKQAWRYNGNSGSCESDSPGPSTFSTKSECDSTCRNVYG